MFSVLSFGSIRIKGEVLEWPLSLLCTPDKFRSQLPVGALTYLLSCPLSQAIQKSGIKGSGVGLGVLARAVKWKINSVSITRLQERSPHSSEMTVRGKQLIGHQLWKKYILPDLCHLPCSLNTWKKKNPPGWSVGTNLRRKENGELRLQGWASTLETEWLEPFTAKKKGFPVKQQTRPFVRKYPVRLTQGVWWMRDVTEHLPEGECNVMT